MRRLIKIIFLLLVFLTSCATSNIRTPSTITPEILPTATTISQVITSSNGAECSLDIAMQNANSFFAGFQQYSVKYTSINGLKILTAWIMLPELDATATTSAEIDSNAQLAMGTALAFQAFIASEESCILQNISHIEIIIVDTEYHGWVSQIANINDIPKNINQSNFSFEALQPLFERAKIGYWRNQPTEKLLSSNEKPAWTDIKQTIVEILPNKMENSSFTIIVDSAGITVYAQWQEPIEDNSEYKEVDMQLTVEKILAVLKTMKTQPNLLDFTVVDKDGNIVKMGRVPNLDLSQTQILNAPFNYDLGAP